MITYCPTCANMLLGKRLSHFTLMNRHSPCAWHVRERGARGDDGDAGLFRRTAVELTDYTKELRYYCQTCPYVYLIDKKARGPQLCVHHARPRRGSRHHSSAAQRQEHCRKPTPHDTSSRRRLHALQITKKAPLVKKQVDDVLGGEDAWKNVAQTEGEGRAGGVQASATGCCATEQWAD